MRWLAPAAVGVTAVLVMYALDLIGSHATIGFPAQFVLALLIVAVFGVSYRMGLKDGMALYKRVQWETFDEHFNQRGDDRGQRRAWPRRPSV